MKVELRVHLVWVLHNPQRFSCAALVFHWTARVTTKIGWRNRSIDRSRFEEFPMVKGKRSCDMLLIKTSFHRESQCWGFELIAAVSIKVFAFMGEWGNPSWIRAEACPKLSGFVRCLKYFLKHVSGSSSLALFVVDAVWHESHTIFVDNIWKPPRVSELLIVQLSILTKRPSCKTAHCNNPFHASKERTTWSLNYRLFGGGSPVIQ
jgi:hypothetical protein